MRQQLIQYVELLFAGIPDSEEMKQEILQNTLDRYDDLVAQGKTPEAAYRLAISGIGDINEILGHTESPAPDPAKQEEPENKHYKTTRAVAIGMYILSAIPVIILSDIGYDTIGVCLTLLMVATATVLMIITSKKEPKEEQKKETPLTPRQELSKSVNSLIWSIALAVYLIVSFITQAWHLTWLIFLIAKCVISLVRAIMDLREAVEYEN